MEYSPNEKERPRDKVISRSDEIPLFDSNTSDILHLHSSATSVKRPQSERKRDSYILVKRYCEFRQLMREGDMNSNDPETCVSSNEVACYTDAS